MIGRLPYSTEIFEAATIRRMIGHWLTILEHVVADRAAELVRSAAADRRTSRADAWRVERHRAAFCRAGLAAAGDRSAQPHGHPDAVALVAGKDVWTYADLDREAAR